VEHQREKQYMQSLVSDLALDTAMLNAGFPRKDARIKAIDTVFRFFKTHDDVKSIPGKLFRTMRRTTYDQTYRRNSITINQLKNSGGMRLIRKKNVADSIAKYDAEWEQLEFYREYYIKNGQTGQDFAEKLVNAHDLLVPYSENTTEAIVSNISDSMLIKINTTYLNEHLNFLMRQKVFTRQDWNLYKHLEENAERLLALIKKEYHLE
ncbi:MAG: hypothetical protein M3O67_00505, partial [Bacteroidota bacterium]|nr:hypothetical protein [Bacteroidota bacterium]